MKNKTKKKENYFMFLMNLNQKKANHFWLTDNR